MLGVTCQQLCKYERGQDRLSAGRLWHCSQAFHVPIEKFFEKDDLTLNRDSSKRSRTCRRFCREIQTLPDAQLKKLDKIVRALL